MAYVDLCRDITEHHCMFGKHFASMYHGTMYGQSATVFAVWGYVISNMEPPTKDGESYIELNPVFLAPMFASTSEEIFNAVKYLCSPDPTSRSQACEGRRLEPMREPVQGPVTYRIVNASHYREIKSQEERRAKNRVATKKWRGKQKTMSHDVATSQTSHETSPPMSIDVAKRKTSHVEVEVEVEAEKIPSASAVLDVHAGAGHTLAHTLRFGFEQRYLDALTVTPRKTQTYAKSIAGICEWLLEQDRHPMLLCQQLLDGFFADDKARAKKFPISFLAHSPAEYLQLNGGSAPPQDRETRNRIADLRKQHRRSRVDQADCKREGNRHGVAECEADQKIIVRELQSLGATLAR